MQYLEKMKNANVTDKIHGLHDVTSAKRKATTCTRGIRTKSMIFHEDIASKDAVKTKTDSPKR